MKKLISLLICVCVIISLFVASVKADTTTNEIYVDSQITASDSATNTYKTITEAVAAATAGTATTPGTTIKFLNNYENKGSAETVNKAYITVDLNGYTYNLKGSTVNAANPQGIAFSKTGCTIKNGRMEMNAYNTSTGNSGYLVYNAEGNRILNVEDIEFDYTSLAELNNSGTQPSGLVRSYQSTNNVTNIRNCTFKYSATRRLSGTSSLVSFVAANCATMNIYNSTFDGDNQVSGICVRGINTISNISIYNSKFSNLSYLFSRSSSLASTSVVRPVFYSGVVQYVDKLAADPDFVSITKGANAYFSLEKGSEEIEDLSTIASPISFYINCNHNYVDTVCTHCFAPLEDERAVEIKMGQGASIRLGQLNGLRFYADVDKNKINELINSGYTVEAGTIIAPLDLVASVNDLTLDYDEDKAVNVPYPAQSIGTYYENGFVASIVNIKSSNTSFSIPYGNLARQFIARSYVKVTKDGDSYISYATINTTQARSLGQVAKLLSNNPDEFDYLSAEIQAYILDWAAAFDNLGVTTQLRYDFFTVKTEGYDGNVVTEECMLLLPAYYSDTSTPTRLIIDVHGFTGTAQKLKTTYTWLQYFAHQNYAVLEVDGGGNTTGPYNMGNPGAVNGNVSAYEYVIANYNIYEDVFVKGGSMGGMTSINLVTSGRIPVIAHINECPVTDFYRQLYSNGWDALNIKRVARFYGFSFDKYNEDHGTNYTIDTFPYSNAAKTVSDAERELFINNFATNVATKSDIWKYSALFFDYETKTFKPGFEDFLTATDETRIAELYNSIAIDYPVPIAIFHGTGDGSVPYKYSEYFVNAVNRSSNPNAILYTYNTNSHGNFGTVTEYLCKDGTEFTVKSGFDDMYKYIVAQEKAFVEGK